MITYTEVPGVVNRRMSAAKASSFSPDVTIPNIPISAGQSWILANTDSVIIDNWRSFVSTLPGFDVATGIFTVPSTGFYNIRVRCGIAANNLANSNAGLEIGDFGQGNMIWAFINTVTNAIALMCDVPSFGNAGSYVSTTAGRTSVMFFDQTVLKTTLNAGDTYVLKVLNKTQLDYLATSNANSIYQSLTLIIDEVMG